LNLCKYLNAVAQQSSDGSKNCNQYEAQRFSDLCSRVSAVPPQSALQTKKLLEPFGCQESSVLEFSGRLGANSIASVVNATSLPAHAPSRQHQHLPFDPTRQDAVRAQHCCAPAWQRVKRSHWFGFYL
jgi:hypothetical protein